MTFEPSLRLAGDPGDRDAAEHRPVGRFPEPDLPGAKYARAITALQPAENNIQITDLMFGIFDELVSTERLKQLRPIDIIRYRRESKDAREQFLEHLSVLQAKQSCIGQIVIMPA